MTYSISQQLVHQDISFYRYWVNLDEERKAWVIAMLCLAQRVLAGHRLHSQHSNEKASAESSKIMHAAVSFGDDTEIIEASKNVRNARGFSNDAHDPLMTSSKRVLNCKFAFIDPAHLKTDDKYEKRAQTPKAKSQKTNGHLNKKNEYEKYLTFAIKR